MINELCEKLLNLDDEERLNTIIQISIILTSYLLVLRGDKYTKNLLNIVRTESAPFYIKNLPKETIN